MPSPVRAVTFDFWRTLFDARTNLRERRDARVAIVAEATGLPVDTVTPAFKWVAEEFLRVHIAEQRTPAAREAIPMLASRLDTSIADDVGEAMVTAMAEVFLVHPPSPIEGALGAVIVARQLGPVGLISDTGITPGSSIRRLLEREGFGEHFTVFAFSDEVGVAKPQAGVFHHAANALRVEPQELLHVGDLEPTDVAGALNVGATAALFAGDNDRYVDGSRANHVFHTWSAFSNTLPELFG